MIKGFDCKRDALWLRRVVEALRYRGFAIVENVLNDAFVRETRDAMYSTQDKIRREIGEARLDAAGELGVLRLMCKFDTHFLRFLEFPELLAVVDSAVSETAIMHLQNGFILPSLPPKKTPKVFQNQFHRDFPRHLDGYVASVNVFFAISAFNASNGGTWILPGTHQQPMAPDPAYVETAALCLECAAGSMIVFDSTLWHAAGHNVSGTDRLAVNHQFTRSYIKQQIDYVRALGNDLVTSLPPRTQQLLGSYTQVVSSLDEYYQPEEKRLYRKGQG
jgi:ectoine hydroxylase-related dioxygenase (phytanoyl-CoA dioxygenase family)